MAWDISWKVYWPVIIFISHRTHGTGYIFTCHTLCLVQIQSIIRLAKLRAYSCINGGFCTIKRTSTVKYLTTLHPT